MHAKKFVTWHNAFEAGAKIYLPEKEIVGLGALVIFKKNIFIFMHVRHMTTFKEFGCCAKQCKIYNNH